MAIQDRIVIRQLEARANWLSPRGGLQRALLRSFFSHCLPEVGGSRSWRKEPFLKYHHDAQAAFFAYALTQVLPGPDWEYSAGEVVPPEQRAPYVDADCYLRCTHKGEKCYKPIQLKELPPIPIRQKSRSPATLQGLLDKLSPKYTARKGQEDLVIAVLVNPPATIAFQQLKLPKDLSVEQVWFYGRKGPDTGFIAGGNFRPGCLTASKEFPLLNLETSSGGPIEMA